jgi:hypothetical protein
MKIEQQQNGLPIIMVLVFFLSLFIGLVCWTDRSLDYTVTKFRGTETNCPWYLSTLATFVAPAAVLLNVGCEIYRLGEDDGQDK